LVPKQPCSGQTAHTDGKEKERYCSLGLYFLQGFIERKKTASRLIKGFSGKTGF
jgi:hypothetical protein